MAIHLKFGNVKGKATLKGVDGLIPIDSLTFGVQRPVQTALASDQDRITGITQASSVLISKELDESDSELCKYAFTGKAQPVEIIFSQQGQNGVNIVARYKFKNTIIADYTHALSHDTAVVNMELCYTHVEFNKSTYDNVNAKAADCTNTLDLVKQKANA